MNEVGSHNRDLFLYGQRAYWHSVLHIGGAKAVQEAHLQVEGQVRSWGYQNYTRRQQPLTSSLHHHLQLQQYQR